MNPLGPAQMTVRGEKDDDKIMTWPLSFAAPGELTAPLVAEAEQKAKQMTECTVSTSAERVVAVREFSDVAMAPVVRRADRELREALNRDGIRVDVSGDSLQLAQYDAIFSMGRRRGEVWIDLGEGTHPW